MKKTLFTTALLVCAMSTISAKDIFGLRSPLINAGIGTTNWGVPLYGGAEFVVADNISVGGTISFQSKKQSAASTFGTTSWKHNIVGLWASANYHLGDALGFPPNFDAYGGVSLINYFWNHSLESTIAGNAVSYSGTTGDGVDFSLQVGGRYFLNKNLGLNAELFGAGEITGLRLGVSYTP